MIKVMQFDGGGGGGGVEGVFRHVRFKQQSQAEKNRSARDFIALDRQIRNSLLE